MNLTNWNSFCQWCGPGFKLLGSVSEAWDNPDPDQIAKKTWPGPDRHEYCTRIGPSWTPYPDQTVKKNRSRTRPSRKPDPVRQSRIVWTQSGTRQKTLFGYDPKKLNPKYYWSELMKLTFNVFSQYVKWFGESNLFVFCNFGYEFERKYRF